MHSWGTSLVVQWLRLCSNAGGSGSIVGQAARSHMPLNSLHAATKHPTCQNEDGRSCMLQLRPGAAKKKIKIFKKEYMIDLMPRIISSNLPCQQNTGEKKHIIISGDAERASDKVLDIPDNNSE